MPATRNTPDSQTPKNTETPKDPKAHEGLNGPALSPQGSTDVDSEDSSPKAHGLESHGLSAREQIMRQWPSRDWETR